MEDEWHWARFSEICEESVFGPRFSGDLYAVDGNVATLRTTDISKDGRIEKRSMPLARLDLSKLNQHILHEGDLVITRSGRVGTAAVFEGFRIPVLPGAFLIRFRLRVEVAEPRFYKYYFNSPAGQELLLSVATGSVQQNLNITSLHGLCIPVPSLNEQRSIVRILGSFDDKIELNRRMNETLEAIACTTFKSWFVDFDPVRAKAEGRNPAGMDKETAALFSDEFEKRGMGTVPKNWKVGKLGDLVKLIIDRVEPATSKDNEPYIALDDMPSKSVNLSKFRLGSEVNSSIIRFEKGDILFGSMRPYFHKVGLAPFNGITRTTTFVLRPKNPEYLSFALLKLFSDEVIEFSTVASVGTTIPYIKWETLSNYQICIPPTSVLKRFERLMWPLFKIIAANGKETYTLEEIRNSLLPRLFSGEIRVKDASRILGL